MLTSYTGDAEEIQIASNVTRIEENAFLAENCPNLKTVYVTSESKVNIYIEAFDFPVLVYVSDDMYESTYYTSGTWTDRLWHLAPESAVLDESGFVLSEDSKTMYAYMPSRNEGENADVVTIPETVEMIKSAAILERVTEIQFTTDTPPEMDAYICGAENIINDYLPAKDLKIRIPAGTYDNYLEANNSAIVGMLWPEDTVEDEETGLAISGNILVSAENAGEEIVVPDGITTIGAWAFQGKTIDTIVIPDSVTDIDDDAFVQGTVTNMDLTGWDITTLYETLGDVRGIELDYIWMRDEQFNYANASIVYNTFYYCDGLFLACPESAVVDGDYVTWETNGKTRLLACTSEDETITIPEGIEEIYYDALYYPDNALEIILPESLETLFEYSCWSYTATKFVFQGTVPKIMYDDNGVEKQDDTRYANVFGDIEYIYVPLEEYGEYVEAFYSLRSKIIVDVDDVEADENGFVILDGVLLGYEGTGGDIVIPDGVTMIAAEAFYENTDITGVTFPDTLKIIDEEAFSTCKNLEGDLIFPEGLKSIGEKAFANCGTFDMLVLPDGLTSVDRTAFRDSDASVIYIGSGITDLIFLGYLTRSSTWLVVLAQEEITTDLLESAELTAADFQVGVLYENGAAYAAAATDTVWPTADYALYDNGCLVNMEYFELEYYFGDGGKVVVPEGVEVLGYSVFAGCTNITELVLPSTLTEINYNALDGMAGVESITFSAGEFPEDAVYAMECMEGPPATIYLKGLDGENYNGAMSLLLGHFCGVSNIKIQGITEDEQGLCILNESDKTVLVTVNSDAEEIVVPEGVTHIVTGAFINCKNLKSVVFPKTLEAAGSILFGWTDTEELKFQSTDLPELWESESDSGAAPASVLSAEELTTSEDYPVCLGVRDENQMLAGPDWKKIIVPEEVFYGYQYRFDGYADVMVSDESGNEMLEYIVDEDGMLIQYAGPGGDLVIPDTVKYIPEGVFTEMENITSVTFSEGLEAIGDYAFSECLSLGGTLVIPDSVEWIGESAFEDTIIESIKWGNGLDYIGNYAFYSCGDLKKISRFPDSLTYIGYGAFQYTTSLTGTLTITDNITTLDAYAFSNSGIEGVKIGSGIKTLSTGVFYGCQNLTGTIEIPDTITSINYGAFQACMKIQKVILPESLKSIPGNAFYMCYALESVEIPDTVTSIGYNAFCNCTSLEKIVIPDSVTSLDTYAFSGCSALKEAYLGEGVTTLNSRCFANCTSLELVSFGSNFTKFGSYAMTGNSALKTYIFKGTTVPTFYNSSTTDSSYSGFPSTTTNKVSIYVPASALSSYQTSFNKVTRISKLYYSNLTIAAENLVVMDAENDGTDGVYFSFENPYEIPIAKWEVLQDGTSAVTVTDGSTGTFISGGTIESSYTLKVYDSSGNSYTFTTAASLLEGGYGTVKTRYEDNIVTDDEETFSVDVWFESEKAAKNAGDITFYIKGENDEAGQVLGTASASETEESCKRTYELTIDVTQYEDATYSVWVQLEGDDTQSEEMELIIQRANNIPQVQNFSVTAEDDGNITVSWEAGEGSDNVVPAITGYRIYRTDEDDNEVLAATVEDATSWSDISAVSGETFSYRVCAVDSHGREGVSSDSKKVTVPKDTEAPVITPTVADQLHYTEYITVDLNATDNREVNSVRLYVKYPDSEKFVLDGTNYSDTYWFNYWPDEEVDGVLKLKVEAYDKSGNVTTEIYTYYQDFTAPDAVAKAETSAEKTRELTVSWEASASDDVKKYLVTLGKTTEEIEASAEREVTFTDLEYDTDYEISIVAEDMVGFQSEALTGTGHTPENPAPVVTLSSPKEGETYHETVSCTVSSEDDYYIDIVGIEFSADGETWESQTSWKAYGPTNSKTVSPYLTQYRSYESIYVRAYVVDTEGSRSETDPVKIYLDYEGPVLDESSFTAEYYSPYLHVSFAQSEDEDASYYELYYGNSSGWTKRATFQHDADNPGQVFTYADSSATFGEKNSYSVYAYDIYGNRTGMGKEFLAYTYEEPTIGQITVVDSPYETTIGGIYNTVTSTISYPDHGSTRIGELTEATYSYVGFDGQTYRVDADVTTVTTGGKLTAALDIDTLKDTTELTLTLKDSAGNTYTKGQTLTLETEQPEEVYGLYVYSSETTIYLNWTIATEVSSTGYRIYRKVDDGDFELYKTISGREKISYEDTDVVEDVTYSYYMTVVSEMGVESDPCLTLSAQLVTDTEAPTITLNPVSGQTFGSYIRITGTANDNVAVKAIRLYKVNGDEEELLVEKQGNTISYKYEPADDVEEGTIVIRGEAEDGKGLKTSVERTYTLDRTGPEQVVNLTYSVTATTAVINWDDVSDNDFAYFSLEKFNPDTAQYEEIKQIKNYRGVSLSGLEPETTYVYRVVAYDLYGNRGTASDAVVIQTTADTTSPVITNIAPSATYYNGDFTVKYTAWDDVGITSMTVQYSKDSASWTDLETFEYEDGATEKTCSYTFNAADYEDGTFYTRAIAKDAAGNVSDQTATAPYTQYGFDRVAPEVPQNLAVEITDGYINVTWDDNTEADKAGYNVYRALSEDSEYTKVASKRQYINYPDKNVVPETAYYYKISVVDKYGNESACTDPVSITMAKDEEAPVVYSISPATGSVMTGTTEAIKVKAADNYQVGKITVEYAVNDGAYATLDTKTSINAAETVESFTVPEGLEHGDTLYIKATATDIYGNESEAVEASYEIDQEAPEVGDLTYEVNDLDVTLSWNCDADDLNGFIIYRKDGSGSFKRVGSQAKNSDGIYSWTDATITEGMKYYTYKIAAVDMAGNTSTETTEAILITYEEPDYPNAVLDCTTSMQVATEYIFDATDSSTTEGGLNYQIDFGDGTEVAETAYVIHKYESTGTYTVTLTVTNEKGYSSTITREVTVYERAVLGTVNVKVTNESGKALSGIPVYFDMDNTTDNIQKTGTNGVASFTALAGTYKVGAYANGYLPDQSQVIITAGTTRTVTLVVKEEEIVTGTFEVNRMTLSEIQAAGIDVANPANQNVVKADVTIYYGSQKVEMTCYSGGGVSSVVIKTESGERKLIAQPVKKTSKGTGAGQSDDETTVDAVVVMDVPVQASCLKEFFDVKLHIFNNATQDFTLINNAVQLDVPDGLTIVRANNTAQGAYVSFDELKGQEQKTLSWIMRGDKEGEYDLTADYYALLQEFDAEISATFKTEEPIKVYGLSNMQLVVQVNQQLLYNTAYFAIGFRNQGSTDVLCPTIDIAEEVMQVAALTGVKDREFDLEMLEQRVSNNYGFSQVVTSAPSVLAGGEMYAKKYAVYGAASDTDVGSLQEVIVRLAEEYGIEVVVEVVNMDLYNGEDAEAKVENMLNGSSSHAYEYLTTDKNFAYYISYGYAQEDVSDEIYDFGQIFFNANLDSITGYEKEELIKKMMAEMLSHEDIQKNVQAQVDTAYIDVAKKTLSNIKTATSLLSNEGKSQLDVMLSDASSIKKLAEELKINGSGGMFEATAYLAGSLGLSALKSELMSAGSGEFCSLAAQELTSQLGEASDIIGVVSEVVTNWNDAAESVNLLMNMQYSYDESMNILNSLAASEDETIRKVANIQIEKLKNHRASMVQEYTELWAKGLVDKTASGVQSSLKKVFAEKTAGKVYGWACVIYKFEDSVAGWSNTYTAQEKAVVAAQMSDAFMQTLNNTEDASTKLQALRYVIEMRFIGERNFTELLRRAYAKEGYSDEEIDKMVITWYDNQVMKISKYRDEIYQTEATTLNVPAAPTVTIDYENCCTKESFSSDYEYSFNNDTWITCSGDTISFTPKVYNASLYVRVKGNSEHVAGTIRVVSLPAIRKLDVEARVLYYDGEYTIKGLTAGEHYQYVLTNEESVDSETLEWPSGAIAEDDGTITISSTEAYDYLVLRLAATKTKIASQYKTFTVKKVTQVAAPKANVASGDVQYGRRITLSCSIPNAIIYYTTDGSQPTKDSAQWTPYTKILITGSTVIKAMASIPEDEGYHDSAVVTYQWKVKKQNQSISVRKSSYSLVYGKQTFSLYATAKTKLYYRTSNSKVVTVSSAGKVTVKGYGTATITIAATATGAYNSATRTVTITVKPTRKTLKSVTAGKKKLTVKFTKDTKASGYQLQYSTSSKFAASKTKTLKLGKNTTSRTIKNLKSGKRYYVRIRSYTTVGGKTVYGSWSKVAYRTVK